MRIARTLQHLLPIILLAVGFLELAALIPVAFDTLDVGGTAAMLGPSSFLPLSLAVVWAALLPPSGFALAVKAATAAGAVLFAAARVGLTTLWWRDSPGMGWSTGTLALAGSAMGAALTVWAIVDALATRGALAETTATPSTAMPATAQTARVADTTLPGSPTTPARPTSPTAPLAGGEPVMPVRQPPVWQSVSTPWPRRDEADPDGTLIRPPLRHGQHS
ncbi:hypothetical protein [Tessaracoccus antarcticus]|uniref:Uncharacterized protein n=1 Tax=Tessaracoccus antarcticus TaxID=2479848 RepID=A0A3M0GY92_9ACTN|nr:hypothetical protein [Tessaracoccus antarcticus]RMB62276.1 hypothetical protein EAX62_06890 [Tessaracoccus antarcticus]